MMANHNANLLIAATNGDLTGVKKALQSGAKLSYNGNCNIGGYSYNLTALGASSCNGHLPVVQFLVESNANPYLPYNEARTPKDWATYYKKDHIASYLGEVMRLPKLLNEINETGYTPLTCCIFNGWTERAKTLIDLGADVCRIDKFGKTPLIYAIEKNSLETVQKLLTKGAIASGISATNYALDLRRNDILKCLVDTKELLIDSIMDDGFTPLTKALTTFNIEMVKYFIENGANPCKCDRNQCTPLDKALELNSMEIAELLLSEGAKVPRNIPKNLFSKIVADGSLEAFRFLIKNKWDINQTDENGKTALALSASNGYLLLSKMLIEHGAKVIPAKAEVEAFSAKNIDFEAFLQNALEGEKLDVQESAQEEE